MIEKQNIFCTLINIKYTVKEKGDTALYIYYIKFSLKKCMRTFYIANSQR